MSAVVAATRRRSVIGALALGVAISSLGHSISFLIVRPHNADTAGTAASVLLTLAGLLLIVYGWRLAVLSTRNAALAASAALAGVVASPACYAWRGTVLTRDLDGG